VQEEKRKSEAVAEEKAEAEAVEELQKATDAMNKLDRDFCRFCLSKLAKGPPVSFFTGSWSSEFQNMPASTKREIMKMLENAEQIHLTTTRSFPHRWTFSAMKMDAVFPEDDALCVGWTSTYDPRRSTAQHRNKPLSKLRKLERQESRLERSLRRRLRKQPLKSRLQKQSTHKSRKEPRLKRSRRQARPPARQQVKQSREEGVMTSRSVMTGRSEREDVMTEARHRGEIQTSQNYGLLGPMCFLSLRSMTDQTTQSDRL